MARLVLLAVMVLAVACGDQHERSMPRVDPLETPLVADGVVTDAEYEQAVQAEAACVADRLGVQIKGPSWLADGSRYEYQYVVSGPPENNERALDAEQKCAEEHRDAVAWLWNRGRGLTPSPRETVQSGGSRPLTAEAADTHRTDGAPTRTRPAADDTASPSDGGGVSSQPAAMQACTALGDDGHVLAAAGSHPTVEGAYTVQPADLDAWWQQDGSGPLTGPDGTAMSDEDTLVTICLIHADAVAAPGSPDMTDEYQWEITAILGDGTPRPLTASVTRPTDLPPAAERDR